MGEFDLIRDFFSDVGMLREDVTVGVGDDGAVCNAEPGNQLVSVMDTLVETIHFPRTSPARSVGHRCLAVNLSDIAAMGATPKWATLSISLPTGARDWLADFAAGFSELALAHGVQLIGGDTVRGPLVVTVNLIGDVEADAFVLRKGAVPGDAIYVSGTLGDAAAGLRSMTRGNARGWLVDQFLFPQPRVALGTNLGKFCRAAIDLSDGFGQDINRILEASGVGAIIDLEKLPLSSELTRQFDDDESRYLAISGGDDYELCMVVEPQLQEKFEQHCMTIECPVTRVGKIDATPGLRFELDGEPETVTVRGHDHFVTDE